MGSMINVIFVGESLWWAMIPRWLCVGSIMNGSQDLSELTRWITIVKDRQNGPSTRDFPKNSVWNGPLTTTINTSDLGLVWRRDDIDPARGWFEFAALGWCSEAWICFEVSKLNEFAKPKNSRFNTSCSCHTSSPSLPSAPINAGRLANCPSLRLRLHRRQFHLPEA